MFYVYFICLIMNKHQKADVEKLLRAEVRVQRRYLCSTAVWQYVHTGAPTSRGIAHLEEEPEENEVTSVSVATPSINQVFDGKSGGIVSLL